MISEMEESGSTAVIPDGCIKNINLSIATPREIRCLSANECPVTHPSQLMNPFLGLPVECGKCESCGTSEPGKCEGHFGFIELPIPVYHPSHLSELKSILNLVCLKCLKLKKGKVKFDLGRESLTDKSSCSHCRDLPPISVREVKNSDGIVSLELKVPSRSRLRPGFWNFLKKYGFPYGDQFSRPLLACEVLEVMKRIPEDTRRKLAGKGHFPQFGYVLQHLPIPPNCLLVPDISDGKSIISNDMSISFLRKILNKIGLIKKSRSGLPNFDSYDVESSELQTAIAQYLHLRGAKKTPQDLTRKLPVAEASNLSAKHWLEKMRSLFISKGSSFTSRSVLTGDAYKGIQEIGIPIEIAKKMTFEERVTEWNLKYLQELVDNRQCLKYGDGSLTYSTEEGSKGYTSLKIGQVVSRRIMDGDVVFVNRPPTTHKHALQAFSVYIHDDHTIKINPLICAPFGADFDGDCVHIFYPQSLAAKAEVRELFSVEKQLCSSHSGTINIQLVNDSLLALKLMCHTAFLKKSTVQQLAMFTSCILPPPAIFKANDSGPLWTVLQILESTLPAQLDCFGDKIFIKNGKIFKLDFSKDNLHLILGEIAMSILLKKSPKEALDFFNTLQPLFMEILLLEGFSISLSDFYAPKFVVDDVRNNLQKLSCLLHQLQSSYNELVDLEVENRLKVCKSPIKDFIISHSSLGNLVDAKSDSSILKLVQQIGFVGPQLFSRGKLYSRLLVDDIFSHHVKKLSSDGVDHPSEAYGLIRSSFFHGLNPYEELIHSLSTREIIVRSSRGLAEPGTLFKNLMAVLRDVAICYDGTVRNMCSNSIVQFQYGSTLNLAPPGEPVGVLAATAISKPAYAAVLDSSQSTNLSWELMKDILLSRLMFKNDAKSRRVMLYLEDCCCGKMFCKEKASLLVQSCLKKVTLRECVVDFFIRYENPLTTDGSETIPCLVGHIHLDKEHLNRLDHSMAEIHKKCEEAITRHKKKRSQFSQIFRGVSLSFSDNCTCNQPCIQFSYYDKDTSGNLVDLDRTIFIMANAICPLLWDTVIKGDPRVQSANITWLGPESTAWIKSSKKACKGEVAIEVVVEKHAAKENIDAWRIVLDASLPIMHLIDFKRSGPSGIQQVQSLLGISAAFDVAIQRLSTAVGTVTKHVLKEHLMLVAHSMTCTGNLIGFNAAGYKALFRSLNVQVPFTEATLLTPMKCFERAAERCHTDHLSSIVASSLWGKRVSIGTGADFQIVWNSSQLKECSETIGNDVYDFLHMVAPSTEELKTTACLGEDFDDFIEENEIASPEHDALFGNLTFDDKNEFGHLLDANGWDSNEDWSRSTYKIQNRASEREEITDYNSSWEKSSLQMKNNLSTGNVQQEISIWEKATKFPQKSYGDPSNDVNEGKKDWDKVPSPAAESGGWGLPWDKVSSAAAETGGCGLAGGQSGRPHVSQTQRNQWEKSSDAMEGKKEWDKVLSPAVESGGWGLPGGQSGRSHESQTERSQWEKSSDTIEGKKDWDKVPSPAAESGGWGIAGGQSGRPHVSQTQRSQWEKSSDVIEGKKDWDKVPSPAADSGGWGIAGGQSGHPHESQTERSQWEKSSDAIKGKKDRDKVPSPAAESGGWGLPGGQSGKPLVSQTQQSQWEKSSDASSKWEKPTISATNKLLNQNQQSETPPWQNALTSSQNSPGWGKSEQCNDIGEGKTLGWDGKSERMPVHESWEKVVHSTDSDSQKDGETWGGWNSSFSERAREDEKPQELQTSIWDKPKRTTPDTMEDGLWTSNSKDNKNCENQAGQKPNFSSQSSWLQTDTCKSGWSQNGSSNTKPDSKWRSDGWGKRGSGDRNAGNNSRGSRPPIPRIESWSAEEEKIRNEIENIVQSIRRIRTSYNDGDRLSEDDQNFIIEKVFDHHPSRNNKVSGEIDHIKVDQHKDFPGSRCFFVVSSDGSTVDFSYVKCLESFVRKTYAEADTFCQKYFRKRKRSEMPSNQGTPSMCTDNVDTPSAPHGLPATVVDSADTPS